MGPGRVERAVEIQREDRRPGVEAVPAQPDDLRGGDG
jgi:hypothetical protein